MNKSIILSLLIATAISHTQKCIHDDLQKKVTLGFTSYASSAGTTQDQSTTSRLLQSTEHQMRIFVDYSKSDDFVRANPNYALKYNFSKRLLDTSKRYFEGMLKVKGPQTLVNDVQYKCLEVTVPEFRKDTDLYVILDAIKTPNTDTFAAAYFCSQDKTTFRPTIGVYELNLASIVNSKMNYLLYFSTFVHEFTHILFFTNELFSSFVLPNGMKRPESDVVKNGTTFESQKRNIIVMKEVVSFARNYFNDQALEGIPLESTGGEGTAGSHWEKALMPMEYMNPSVEYIGFVSEFTMIFMQSTGWYSVDMGYGQPYAWGNNRQDYRGSTCPMSQDHCSILGEKGCSGDFKAKTTCEKYDNYMGNCFMKRNTNKYCLKKVPEENLPDALEDFGSSSRCFMVRNSPKCLKSACNSDGTVTLKLGAADVTCSKNGEKVDFQGSAVSCPPDLVDFCNKLKDACPDDCSGYGICLSNKKCFCIEGFEGENCSNQTLPDPSTSTPPKPNLDYGSNINRVIALIMMMISSIIII